MIAYNHRFSISIILSNTSMYDEDDVDVEKICKGYVTDFYNSFFKIPVEYRLTIHYGQSESEVTVKSAVVFEDNVKVKEVSVKCDVCMENIENNRLKLVHPEVYEKIKKYNDTFIKRFIHFT